MRGKALPSRLRPAARPRHAPSRRAAASASSSSRLASPSVKRTSQVRPRRSWLEAYSWSRDRAAFKKTRTPRPSTTAAPSGKASKASGPTETGRPLPPSPGVDPAGNALTIRLVYSRLREVDAYRFTPSRGHIPSAVNRACSGGYVGAAASGQVLLEEAAHVPPHDRRDLLLAEAAGEERLGEQGKAARVEGSGDRAVEVGAEGDVLDPRDVHRVAQGAHDRLHVRAADRGLPEADAHDAARARDPPELLVREVAGVVAGSLYSRVRDDHGTAGHREHLLDRPGRRVGEVDEHRPLLEPVHDLAPQGREPALRDAVGGARDLVVEEVGEAHHPVPRDVHGLHVRRLALEHLRSLQREEPGHERRVLAAPLQERREV